MSNVVYIKSGFGDIAWSTIDINLFCL